MDLVAEAYYEEGANDFTPEFMSLRNQLLARHLEKISIERTEIEKGKVEQQSQISGFCTGCWWTFMPGMLKIL